MLTHQCAIHRCAMHTPFFTVEALENSHTQGLEDNSRSGLEECIHAASFSAHDGAHAGTSGPESISVDIDDVLQQLESFNKDIVLRVKWSPLVAKGMKTFLRRYKNLTSIEGSATARLSSALTRFGWVFGGTVKSTKCGYFRRGKRIPVNAKAAGRRRGKISRGKAKAPSGRPVAYTPWPASNMEMPIRRATSGKRLHSLKQSIIKGTQNAGKW